MKKAKRILAILGIIVLVGLYLTTLACAIFAKDNVMNLLMASLYATVVIPVLIWAYTFIYKLMKKDSKNESDADKK